MKKKYIDHRGYAYCRRCCDYHSVKTEEGPAKVRGVCGIHGLDAPYIFYTVSCPKDGIKYTNWKTSSYKNRKRWAPHFKPV